MKRFTNRVTLLFAMVFSVMALAADPVIIDVRTDAEFNSGHLQGALHMQHDKIGSLIEAQVPNKDTKILLYCRSGGRANVAKKTLESLGYTAVTNGGGLKDLQGKYPLAQ
ncbi:MAG: rhodanese-like domain-containing protein [Gammaproteobacteria bacterium]|nr:rhodanese-like domain-containing protein [Gammaproteobacteria bacterium]